MWCMSGGATRRHPLPFLSKAEGIKSQNSAMGLTGEPVPPFTTSGATRSMNS